MESQLPLTSTFNVPDDPALTGDRHVQGFHVNTFKAVLASVAQGESIRSSLALCGIPAHKYYKALQDSPSLTLAYTYAQQAKAELIADEIIDIADNDIDPQRARNRMDARKWWASKIKPTKYGDRLDLTITEKVSVRDALGEALNRKNNVPDKVLLPSLIPQVADKIEAMLSEPTDMESVANEYPDIFGTK